MSEIEILRKKINTLLKNIFDHSEKFTGKSHIPSLEVSVLLSKLNNLQETLAVLKYQLEKSESKTTQIPPSVIGIPTTDKIMTKEKPTEKIESEQVDKIITNTDEPSELNTKKESTIEEKTVGDKLQLSPISNLSDAFSLNDRYLFANEMFEKNMEQFTAFVNKLDNCVSFEEANTLFEEKQKELNWDLENEFIQSFTIIIKRRFI